MVESMLVMADRRWRKVTQPTRKKAFIQSPTSCLPVYSWSIGFYVVNIIIPR